MNYEIREDSEGNVFVKDLSMIPVTTFEEVMSIISMGLRVRATHETKMNAQSSRSHTIFSINIIQRDKATSHSLSSMLHLVDLAGSERLKKSESQGVRLKEALHINSSLTSLGKVIMALDPSLLNVHIPYRESKLTRILQNSLGGNSYTSVLAAIHPHVLHYEECLSTLQFANRCRNVKNNPRVNHAIDNEDKDRKIRRLLDEIQQLRLRIGQLEFQIANGEFGGKLSNDKLRKVFQKLGIDVLIDKNGNISYKGKEVNVNDIIQDDNTPSVASGLGSLLTGSILETKIRDEKIKKIIEDLKEQNKDISQRNKTMKQTIQSHEDEIMNLKQELARLQVKHQHESHEHIVAMDAKVAYIDELKKLLKSQHDGDIERLLHDNDNIVSTQNKFITNLPKSLESYTSLLQKLKKKKLMYNEAVERELEDLLLSLDANRLQELEHVKLQYSGFLDEKDKQLKEFVDKFNIYHTKKSKQSHELEEEIVKLSLHNERLEEILDEVETGKYHVKQSQQGNPLTRSLTGQLTATATYRPVTDLQITSGSAIGAVILPKGLRPYNPMRPDSNELKLAKKILAKHKERVAKLEQIKQETFKKTLQRAAKVSHAAALDTLVDDPVLQLQIGEFLIGSKSQARLARPQSALLPSTIKLSSLPPHESQSRGNYSPQFYMILIHWTYVS